MEIIESRLLNRLLSFSGRLSRGPIVLAAVVATATFAILFVFLESALGRGATWLLYPPFLWIVLSLSIRRLHDRARSAWFLLVACIPILGPVWLFVELFLRSGTSGDNQYGDDPRTLRADYLTVP
jgi:uncharacterized membrane protein YhaH (DUF805 family)